MCEECRWHYKVEWLSVPADVHAPSNCSWHPAILAVGALLPELSTCSNTIKLNGNEVPAASILVFGIWMYFGIWCYRRHFSEILPYVPHVSCGKAFVP